MTRPFPVENIQQLAEILGVTEAELWQVAKTAATSYWHKDIPKPAGGTRKLTSPFPRLKLIQKKLHKQLFQTIQLSGVSHYGLKGLSNITNACKHVDNKTVFTFDLKSFFPSVRPERVCRALVDELGCPKPVASIITKLVTSDYQLPQGAPTSTDIANLVTLRLQRRLSGLAKIWSLKFTIYADDITFSGGAIPHEVIDKIKHIVRDEGFKIHPEKGGVYDKSMAQIVTGLNVAHGVTVGKTKKEWRAELHKVTTEYEAGNVTGEERAKAEARYRSRMAYAASAARIHARLK
jgi:hypothetical protein